MKPGLSLLWRLAAPYGPVHVIDVGANPIGGDAPWRVLLEAGCATLTGFEPQPEALAALDARKSAAETYHPVALGAGGAAVLNLFRHSGFASLFPGRADTAALVGFGRAMRPAGNLPVMTARLDDLAGIAPADYLKIDVQGAELDIISGGRVTLGQAVLVQTEMRFLPLYVGEPGFGALDGELRAQGFMFHDFAFLKRAPIVSGAQGRLRPAASRQVVDGDAYYVRDLTTAAGWSVAQLARLALLADAVMDSPTLALFCIEALVARGAAAAGLADDYLATLPPRLLREA